MNKQIQYRKEQGRCYSCGHVNDSSTTTNCERCTAKRKEAQRIMASRMTAYKLERGCMDCGYNKLACALQFDHVPGTTKRMDVARMTAYAWKNVLAEMEKCEVVCANCHAERTYNRTH